MLEKQAKVNQLINMHRVRGHPIADLDPLQVKEPKMHAELDPATYGLTIWDLDREFLTGTDTGIYAQVGGTPRMALGDLLGVLARRALPHRRRRVHAHPGSGREALDAGAARRCVA
ncbi:MAG: hypothetical protein R2695_01295 [Acidimicrobiales bacterium]